ncbi:MAG: DUF1349 domain-containing protein [Planctomycetes bacterium]|nr:DUF1349 domain-containing protein [Planctomycetota bacterium]
MNPRTFMMLVFALSSLMVCATVKAQDVDEIESRINKFSAECDINIAFKSVPTSDDLDFVEIGDSADDREMTEVFWRFFEPEVRKYPVAVLRKANIETFALLRSVKVNGKEIVGGAAIKLRTVYFSMRFFESNNAATKERNKLVIHHEIYHMLDWAINPRNRQAICDEWSRLNKPGITYKSGPLDFDTSGKIPGFLFGHTGPNAHEDMADTFAFLMVGSSFEKIENRLAKDEYLKAKFDYLKTSVRSAVPEFTDEYTRKIHESEVTGKVTNAQTSDRGPAVRDAGPPIVIDGWGRLIDSDRDCTVKAEQGKLTVNVPARLHDLNPRNGKLNAPRVLQEVEGDFVVQVKVSGKFEPGGNSTAPRSVPFNGAGLLVWADEKNYLRLERNMFLVRGTPACYPPLFEVFQDGQYQGTNPPAASGAFFEHESTCFRLERKGHKIAAHYSHDGKEWTALKEVTVTLPTKVQVGVAAINTSDKPLAVQFDEFELRAGK